MAGLILNKLQGLGEIILTPYGFINACNPYKQVPYISLAYIPLAYILFFPRGELG